MSVTAYSWFVSLISAHSSNHLNIDFPENHQPKLWRGRNQYRIFRNENIIYTVFKHNEFMKAISTKQLLQILRSLKLMYIKKMKSLQKKMINTVATFCKKNSALTRF